MEDLAHEVWITVLNLLREGRYDGTSSLRTFIIAIAENIWRNWYRKNKRKNTIFLASGEITETENFAPDPDALSKVIAIEDKETLQLFHQYVDQLQDRHTRLILKLFATGSLNFPQIAELLDLGVEQVHSKYYHVRSKLRDVMQGILRWDIKQRAGDFDRLDDYYMLLEAIKQEYRYFDFEVAMSVLHHTILEQVKPSDNLSVRKLRAWSVQTIAEVLTNFGQVQGTVGGLAKSRQAFSEFKSINDTLLQVQAKHTEAVGWRIAENFSEALGCYRDAFAMAETLSHKDPEAQKVTISLHRDYGKILYLSGKQQAGRKGLLRSLVLSEESGHAESVALANLRLGEYYVHFKEFDKAYPALRAAEKGIPDRFLTGRIILDKIWAEFNFAQGYADMALNHINRSLELSQKKEIVNQIRELNRLQSRYQS